MSILEQINEQFPIRRNAAQKGAFRKWLIARAAEMGYRARVEENDKGRHQNVVIGDPEHAQITFTAHYDTPACIGIPNLMIPRNFPVFFLYQAAIVGGLLLLSFAVGFLAAMLLGAPKVLIPAFFCTYMALLLLMLYGPANKHNVNDNTSGVAALMELLARLPAEDRDKAAFIFFDNEEKGCRGSKAYARDHLQVQHTQLIVNLDCVGVGENILLAVPKLARNMPQYEVLERTLSSHPGRAVHFFGSATTRGNSDYRSFKCGVGVSAYSKVGGIGFCTGDIHTWRDTQADQANLEYLAEAFRDALNRL